MTISIRPFAVATLFAACAAEPSPPATAAVRDSASVTIVENAPAGRWAPEDAWRLSAEPVVTIGVADGPAEYTFYELRSALRLATGEIVVANGGTNELRFYDTTGTFVRAVGGEGSGPGEYRRLWGVWMLGTDSLLANDLSAGASVLSVEGTFARTLTLDRSVLNGYPSILGTFADGSLLVRVWPLRAGDQGDEGVRRDDVVYARYSGLGDAGDSLVTRPGNETATVKVGTTISIGPPPFGRAAVTATAGDRWYYGSSDRYEIEVYSPEGQLLRLIRLAVENRPVSDEMVRTYREVMGAGGDLPAQVGRRLLELAMPETMPAYNTLLVDDERDLWVGAPNAVYGIAPEGAERRWDVFAPDGTFLGRVTHDARFQPTHIGADFVLGIARDEDGVEQVRMYRLIKPGAGSR